MATAAPGHLQPGEAEQAENEDGVKDDVRYGAHKLRAHGQRGPAGGLQQPLKAELAENADGAAKADGSVPCAVLHDSGLAAGLKLEEGPGEENADQGKDNKVAQGQKNTGVGGFIGHVLPLFAQGAGQQRVNADSGAAAEGDHQILQGEGQRDRVEGVLAELGHENTVNHIVKSLHQHGDHHGNRHTGQQPSNGRTPILFSCSSAPAVFCVFMRFKIPFFSCASRKRTRPFSRAFQVLDFTVTSSVRRWQAG